MLSAFLWLPVSPALGGNNDTPLPSRRPQTFYASPEMLKQIRERMQAQSGTPQYRAVKEKKHKDEIRVSDPDKNQVLKYLRDFHIEDY